MRKIRYDGVEGVFYTNQEFQTLQNKIIAQKQLINELSAEKGGSE